jgi:hypothetical protein
MARPTRTTSGRWEIKDPNDPGAKWTHNSGAKWRSKSEGDFDLGKVKKWAEDMEEWSEMMHEALIELRERVAPIALLQQNVDELNVAVETIRRGLKDALKRQKRRPARGTK